MSTVKSLFLMNLSVVGVILALGVYQVPQPWRGMLVALLFVGLAVGFFVLRVMAYRQDRESGAGGRRRQQKRSLPKKRARRSRQSRSRLDIVRLDDQAQGRHTVG